MTVEAPERIVEFPALKEAQEKLDAKRKSLRDIFAEAGDTYDMSKVQSIKGDTTAKVEFIRSLNAEIDDCKKQVDELLVVARAAGAAKEAEQVEQGGRERPREPERKDGQRKSFGEQFVASEAFKGFRATSGQGPQAQIDVSLKSLLGTGAWEPETTRTGRIEMYPTRPAPHVADLIPQTTTGQAAVVYMEETVFGNNAAEVFEGDQFPE